MSNLKWEHELNPEQLRAVREADGPCLVLAGAGSGKTRTIVYRVAHLIKNGVNPSSILLLTFTNKAANEMLGRAAALLGTEKSGIVGGTFHSVGNRILRGCARRIGYDEKFTILDSEDAKSSLKLCMKDAGFESQGKMAPSAAVVQSILSFARNSKMPVADVVLSKYPKFFDFIPQVEEAARAFAKRKLEANSMDFDDLLIKLLETLRSHADIRARLANQFRYVLVDEYQDTNPVQAEIVDALASVHKNILAVGDDAQSIYSFRAATVANILDFPRRYPGAKIFKLETNYRSTPDILELANSIILNNTNQFAKRLKAVRPAEGKPTLAPQANQFEEAEFIAERILELFEEGYKPPEIAVLFRAAHHSQALELELGKRGIPYEYRGGIRFFERSHIKDALAYLRVFSNSKDQISWMRILELQEGIGATGAARIAMRLQGEGGISEALRRDLGDILTPRSLIGFKKLSEIFFQMENAGNGTPGSLLRVVAGSSYKDYLESEYPDSEERLADLEQLAQFADRAAELAEFLSEASLADNFSAPKTTSLSASREKIVLSTIHQAKGLEWEAVFILRLTDADFPNRRALFEEGGLEEERRLFYVATTRAKRLLCLTYPLTVGLDSFALQSPSMFLDEVDHDLLETRGMASAYNDDFIELDSGGEIKQNKSKPRSYLIDI